MGEFRGKAIPHRNRVVRATALQGITERKRMKEALRESEQRYQQLFEGIDDAVMVYNLQGRFLNCNKATLQQLGYRREEFLHLRITDIVHPDFYPEMEDNQKRMWAGEATIMESAYRSKNGRIIPVEVKAHKIEYSGVSVILALVRDITERVQGEEKLRESEAIYRELADNIPDVFFAMDTDLRCIYWNKASEDLTGIPARDAFGKSLYELLPEMKEESAEEVCLEVLRTQQPWGFAQKCQLGSKDYCFEISVYPAKRGLSVFARDLTEQVQAKERCRTFFEESRDAICITARGGEVIDANQAALDLFGYEVTEEMTGMGHPGSLC